MKKQNKYIYYWVIWSNYGYGWEAESWYDKREYKWEDVKEDLAEYKKSGHNAQYRIRESRQENKMVA